VPARKVARLDGARHPPALHNRAEPVGAERGSGAAALGATSQGMWWVAKREPPPQEDTASIGQAGERAPPVGKRGQ
jgi:hypothetical protein